MNFESIEVVFENCESVVIDNKYIVDMLIEDIKESFQRIAINSIRYMKTSDFILFSINSKIISENIDGFIFEQSDDKTTGKLGLDRLKYSDDITGIHINTSEYRRKDTYIEVKTDCQCTSCKKYPNDLESRKNRAIEDKVEYFHCDGCPCPYCNKYVEKVITSNKIYPIWCNEDEYSNKYQHIHVNDDGDILVAIFNEETTQPELINLYKSTLDRFSSDEFTYIKSLFND